MRHLPTVTALTTLAISMLCAGAASAKPEPKIDCRNATSNYEMSYCADQEYAAADLALNSAYQRALKAIPGRASDAPFDAKNWEQALRESQRAWVAFRDAECQRHAPMHLGGGTGTTLAVLGCLIGKTETHQGASPGLRISLPLDGLVARSRRRPRSHRVRV